MRVRIGSGDVTYGTVEDTPQGLRYAGEELTLHYYLRAMWRQARAEGMTPARFVASLPERINRQQGRHWAEVAPESEAGSEAGSASLVDSTDGQSIRLYNPNHDSRGRFAPGSGIHGEHEGEGGGGGGGSTTRPARPIAERTTVKVARGGGHAGARPAAHAPNAGEHTGEHTTGVDPHVMEHGDRAPFTHAEADAAWGHSAELRNGKNVSETRVATLHGEQYVLKRGAEGFPTLPDEQMLNEAATVAGMRALGYGHLAPSEAYHVVDASGESYAVIHVERGRSDFPKAAEIAAAVPRAELERAWLGEYLLGMRDRHRGNLLLDEQAHTIRHIDFGFGLKETSGVEFRSWARGALEAQALHTGARDGVVHLARAEVVRALRQQSAVEHALGRYALSHEATDALRQRFTKLRSWLAAHPGDVNLAQFTLRAGIDLI